MCEWRCCWSLCSCGVCCICKVEVFFICLLVDFIWWKGRVFVCILWGCCFCWFCVWICVRCIVIFCLWRRWFGLWVLSFWWSGSDGVGIVWNSFFLFWFLLLWWIFLCFVMSCLWSWMCIILWRVGSMCFWSRMLVGVILL